MEGIAKPGEVIIRESKYINQESAQVVVSFELSYHDWSKLKIQMLGRRFYRY
jgi:hypothetical protein